MYILEIKMQKSLNIAENIIGTLCIIYYTSMRICYGKIVFLWVWLFLALLLLAKSTVCILTAEYAGTKIKKTVKILSHIYDTVFAIFLVTFAVFLVFAAVGMTEKHGRDELQKCDTCIIPGAAVYGEEPSPILDSRIMRAYEFLTDNQNSVAVCTGGVGTNASISEGECIKRSLIKLGIPNDRLITETHATTTVENMKLSLSRLTGEPKTVAVITSGFHLSRSKLILSNFTNAEIIGIPADGGGALLPHYLLREYVVLCVDVICGRYSLIP